MGYIGRALSFAVAMVLLALPVAAKPALNGQPGGDEKQQVLKTRQGAGEVPAKLLRKEDARIREHPVTRGMEATEPAIRARKLISLTTMTVRLKLHDQIGGRQALNGFLIEPDRKQISS